ncbi:MAG TPA: oxidoreductase [Burkholderiaceae bacterium]|nr:oxidoreductase [Burkholderiaceae bacterium]
MNRRKAQIAILSLASGVAGPLCAADPPPLLVVAGRIRRTNDPDRKTYRFSEEEFLGLPQASITTSTVWTPRSRFDGPRLLDVLKHVDAQGTELRLRALNDYSITIPWSDLERYQVILAHSRNGVRMAASTYGPLWLMYPRDEFPDELSGPVAGTKYIWQVRAIEVR